MTGEGERRGGREGGRGFVGDETLAGGSVQHCVQLVGQVVKHAADVVQDGDRCLLVGESAGSWTAKQEELGPVQGRV